LSTLASQQSNSRFKVLKENCGGAGTDSRAACCWCAVFGVGAPASKTQHTSKTARSKAAHHSITVALNSAWQTASTQKRSEHTTNAHTVSTQPEHRGTACDRGKLIGIPCSYHSVQGEWMQAPQLAEQEVVVCARLFPSARMHACSSLHGPTNQTSGDSVLVCVGEAGCCATRLAMRQRWAVRASSAARSGACARVSDPCPTFPCICRTPGRHKVAKRPHAGAPACGAARWSAAHGSMQRYSGRTPRPTA